MAKIERRASDGDSAADLLERRWFAASKSAQELQCRCEILREVMEVARANWREAESQRMAMEALRDSLEEQFAAQYAECRLPAADKHQPDENMSAMSAA